LGMSRGYALVERSLAQGYSMIGLRRGLCSLLAGLRSEHRDLFVGLDGKKPNVQRHLSAPLRGNERLVAYVERAAGTPPGVEIVAEIVDRFGTPAPCEVVEVPRIPRTEAGDIDLDALAGLRAGGPKAERLLPRTGLERTIAAI